MESSSTRLVGVTLKPGDVVGHIYEAGEEIAADGAMGMLKLVLKFRLLTMWLVIKRQVLAKVTPEQPVPVKSDGRIKSSPAARRLARS